MNSMKKSVFVIPGFSFERARLQPWRYALEMARALSADNEVTILTDQPASSNLKSNEGIDPSISVRSVSEFSPLRTGPVVRALKEISPHEIIWSVTPKSIAYAPLFRRLKTNLHLLVTCPFYELSQFPRAAVRGVPFHEYSALLQQTLVPRIFFRTFLNEEFVSTVTVLSQASARHLLELGVYSDRIQRVPVGIDSDWKVDSKSLDERLKMNRERVESGKVRFLYLGGAKRIRGFQHLVECFSSAVEAGCLAELTLLARGASDNEVSTAQSTLLNEATRNQVTMVGGMLSPNQIREKMDESDVIVLPFIFVPSDVPIAVLEALARGKPVLSTRVDGIPELVDGRGLVVDSFSRSDLTAALLKLSESPSELEKYAKNAHQFMKEYPTWEQVHALFRQRIQP